MGLGAIQDLKGTIKYQLKIKEENKVRQFISFVNTTTTLPADTEVVDFFFQVLSPQVMNVCGNFYDTPIPIYCVSAKELDFYRNLVLQNPDNPIDIRKYTAETRDLCIDPEKENIEFNPDLLGVFIPKSKEHKCNSIIMVSPEKVMKASFDFKKIEKITKNKDLYEIYLIFFVTVVLHEIGHWVMSKNEPDHRASAKWIANRLDEGGDDDQRYLNILFEHEHYCGDNDIAWTRNYTWEKLIEESLANRFVLLHNWKNNQKKLIWKFISKQPQEYSAAVSWKETKSIKDTICSWKRFKWEKVIDDTLKKYDSNNTFLKDFESKLLSHKKINSFNFNLNWLKFCKTHIYEWLKNYDAILWDTFGVLYNLIDHEKDLHPLKAIEFAKKRLNLVQTDDMCADIWLTMAKIYKTISDADKYHFALNKALEFSKKTDGYWEDKRTNEIESRLKEL